MRADARVDCIHARRSLIAERLRCVLTEALHGGMSATEIRKIVQEQLGELAGQVATVSSAPQLEVDRS